MKQTIDPKPFFYLIGGIGALMLIKPLLRSIGLLPSAEEEKRQQENEASREEFLKPEKREPLPTKSPGEWAIIADQIYEALRYSSVSDRPDVAGYQVSRVKNIADLKLLIKAFGKRQEYTFGIPTGQPKDLQQFITGNLKRDAINIINRNYEKKGIKFRF